MTKFKKLSIPYLCWMIIFTGLPLLMMIFFAFSNIESFSAYTFRLDTLRLSNNLSSLFDMSFVKSFSRSILYALIATILCLLIGYPIAYFISRSKLKHKYLLLLIFVMPMWTNMLLRVQTINNLLSENSFFSNVLGFTIDLSNQKSLKIILVMTLVYLPFMIFPIYTVLEKMDMSVDEASHDLGCGSVKTFFKITLPLSMKGISSGVMMVFLPAAMSFTIPKLVTKEDPNYSMVGLLIERQFKNYTTFYNIGSVWSLVIIILVLGALFIISKTDAEGETLL